MDRWPLKLAALALTLTVLAGCGGAKGAAVAGKAGLHAGACGFGRRTGNEQGGPRASAGKTAATEALQPGSSRGAHGDQNCVALRAGEGR